MVGKTSQRSQMQSRKKYKNTSWFRKVKLGYEFSNYLQNLSYSSNITNIL